MTDRWVPISAFVAGLTMELALHLMGYRPERTCASPYDPCYHSGAASACQDPFADQFPVCGWAIPASKVADQAVGQWRGLAELYQQARSRD